MVSTPCISDDRIDRRCDIQLEKRGNGPHGWLAVLVLVMIYRATGDVISNFKREGNGPHGVLGLKVLVLLSLIDHQVLRGKLSWKLIKIFLKLKTSQRPNLK